MRSYPFIFYISDPSHGVSGSDCPVRYNVLRGINAIYTIPQEFIQGIRVFLLYLVYNGIHRTILLLPKQTGLF